MKKIKIDMSSFSTEEDLNKAIEAMNAALPDGQSATPASQKRDSNGKVIETTVAFSGNITAAQHHAVREAAINSNPGIAVATPTPVGGGIQDMETVGSPGTTLTSIPVGESPLVLNLNLSAPTNQAEWQVSAEGEGVGDTGRALILKDTNTSHVSYQSSTGHYIHFNSGNISFVGSANGFPTFTGLAIAGKVNMGDNGTKDKGDQGHGELFSVRINGPFNSVSLSVSRHVSLGYYNINLGYMFDDFDTGSFVSDSVSDSMTYVAGAWEDFKLSVDAAGNIIGQFGATILNLTAIESTFSSASINTHISERQSDTSTLNQQEIKIDDMSLIVKSA